MAESRTSLPSLADVDVDADAGVDAADAGGAGAVVGAGADSDAKNISQQPLLFSAVSLFSEIIFI